MKRCKITILKTTLGQEHNEECANPESTGCAKMNEGQVFFVDRTKPDGFCDKAWKAVYQHVVTLTQGTEPFYYGDCITKEGVAICSCNHCKRPIIVKIERLATEVPDCEPAV